MTRRETLDFKPGTLLERRYVIGRLLGEGGMGAVYQAQHKVLERDVAIKLIPLILKPGGVDPTELFEQEARAQAKIKHENIVEVFDGGVLAERRVETEPIGFLVMELVEGGSLRRMMHKKPVERLTATIILTQIATALAAIHDKRILHRDIKPENILVTKAGRVKLADLGNARFAAPSKYMKYKTNNPRPAGTVHYMPYEQLMNTGMDETVDTFALAVIAFELFSGRHPRAKDGEGPLPTSQEALMPMLAKLPMPTFEEAVKDLPEGVSKLLQRGLSFHPEERPHASEMEGMLREYAAELREKAATAKVAGPQVALTPDPPKLTPRGTVQMGPRDAEAARGRAGAEDETVAQRKAAAPAPAPSGRGTIKVDPALLERANPSPPAGAPKAKAPPPAQDVASLATEALPQATPPSPPAAKPPAEEAIPPAPNTRPNRAVDARQAAKERARPIWMGPAILVVTFLLCTVVVLVFLVIRKERAIAAQSTPVPSATAPSASAKPAPSAEAPR